MPAVPPESQGLEDHIDPETDSVTITTLYGTRITSGWQDKHDPDAQLAGDWLAVYDAEDKQVFCVNAEEFTCMDIIGVHRTLLEFMRAIAGLPPRA